jgi:predicted dehydrogenase/flavin reductase (DIM6/NTAB) family NADH-FMN oxidoreductase RutF
MRIAAQTIWDTRIQCVCGVIAAREGDHTEVYFSATFGQATTDPPRIIINPNRLYAIEGIIRRCGRFSLNLLSVRQREEALRLIRMRRREPNKIGVLGWQIADGESGIPYLPDHARTLFCEVESMLDTGDHSVMICRVVGTAANPRRAGEPALIYQEIAGDAASVSRLVKGIVRSPISSFLLSRVRRFRPAPPADLPAATYRDGGQTEDEIRQILEPGVLDRSRVLRPPGNRPQLRFQKSPGICVVGTRWGLMHCELVRKVHPKASLFICGRDETRTSGLARAFKADGYFTDIKSAARDSRVQALVLAMPHHQHREAVEIAMRCGKHVLLEKPIATALQDADAMIDTARRAGRILMVAEDMHFRPAVSLVAERISLGDVGEPLQLLLHCGGARRPEGWMADSVKAGGGILMDSGVHYIRAMRLLFGEPDWAFALAHMRVNTKVTGEDGIQVIFNSRSGWTASLLATWSYNYGALPDIVVFGDRGTFHIWARRRYVDYYPAAPRPITRILGYVRPYWLQSRLMRPTLQRVRIPIEGDDMTGYSGEMREFLAAVCEEREPATTPADARRDVEIVLSAYESLRSGQRAAIPAIG